MAKQSEPIVLEDDDSLVAWAEDEGWFDESELFEAKPGTGELTLVMGLRMPEEVEDPRERFDRTTARYFEFSFVAEDPGPVPATFPLGSFTLTELARTGGRFGFRMEIEGVEVVLLGRRFRVHEHGEVEKPTVPELARELAFHGPGPVTNAQIRAAVAAAGVSVELYENWKGSGQAMGSVFVTSAEPTRAGDGAFAMAIRVVRADRPATDAEGMWIHGQSSTTSAYVVVTPEDGTDPELCAAVVRGLGTIAGLTWGHSGSRLVETPEAREEWLRAALGLLPARAMAPP